MMNDAVNPIELAVRANGTSPSSIRSELDTLDDLNARMKNLIDEFGVKLGAILHREDSMPADSTAIDIKGASDIGDWVARANESYRRNLSALNYLMNRVDL